jgi:16S rRNA (guanine1207-N2)-methyltransferase
VRVATAGSAYRSWESRIVDVNGVTVHLAVKPGQAGYRTIDYAELLLAEHAVVTPNDVVLNLECGAGLCGIVAARRASTGKVIIASPNLVDVLSARQSVLLAGLSSNKVDVVHSSGVGVAAENSTDVVIARSPKGRLPVLRAIWEGFHALRPGGRFYLAGSGEEGIQSALTRVERLFGNVEILDYRKGTRVGLATKNDQSPPLPEEFSDPIIQQHAYGRFIATVDQRDFVVCSRPGVFSWDSLDAGAAALIEAMKVDSGERVLDLGCGTGIVGVVAATRTDPKLVCLVDVDADAIASAAETAAVNGVPECSIVASDSISAIEDQRFDVVVTNPPFHVGKATESDVAREFIQGASLIMRKAGRAYVVANRFLPYENAMRDAFGNVETVLLNSKYKVLLGRAAARRR